MKHPQTTSSNSSDASSQSKRIDVMFSRFAAFYGHVWRSQFKHEEFFEFAKKEWQDGLSPFADDVLNKAIIACRNFCEMPPTLPQVITHCRDIKKRDDFYVARNDVTPAKPEIIRQHLQQCKDMLSKR